MSVVAKAMTLAFILSASDKMSRVIDQAVKKSSASLSSFERTSAKLGASLMKKGMGMTAAGAAVGGAVLDLSKQTAKYGDDALKTSQKVGVGVEEWQKMAYAARFAGVAPEQLSAAMVKLNKKMIDAGKGNKEAAQTFMDLGIKLKDTEGNLRAPNEILEDIAGVFEKVKDGATKTALSVDFFGKSGADLIPLLNAGKTGLKEMSEEAERTGNVLSADAAKACEQFNDDLERITTSANGLKNQFTAVMIPVLDSLANKLRGIIGWVTGWVKANPDLAKTIGTLALWVSGLLIALGSLATTIGFVIFTVGKVAALFRFLISVFKAVQFATFAVQYGFMLAKNSLFLFRIQYAAFVVWSKIAAAAQWLFNTSLFGCPIVWIIVGIMAVIAAVVLLVKNWDKVAAFFKGLWDKIKAIFVAVWEWVKSFFKKWGVVILAVVAPFIGIPLLIWKYWDNIKAWFAGLWEWVKSFFKKWGIEILAVVLPFIGIPLLIFKHWDKIKAWFAGLWDSVKGIFLRVNDFFSSLHQQFFDWGINIIQGLIDGVVSAAGKVWETITDIGKKIGDTFCSILGINSPSRLFMQYGVNITQGLTGGISQGEGAVAGASEGLALQTTRGVSNSIQSNAVSTSNAMNSFGGMSLNYAPVINMSGGGSEETRSDFVAMLRKHRDEIISIMQRFSENKTRLSFT